MDTYFVNDFFFQVLRNQDKYIYVLDNKIFFSELILFSRSFQNVSHVYSRKHLNVLQILQLAPSLNNILNRKLKFLRNVEILFAKDTRLHLKTSSWIFYGLTENES